MVRKSVVLILLLALLPAGTAAATYVFGPREYRREAGKPQLFEAGVALDSGRCEQTSYVLEVRSEGVSSAEVAVNGTSLFSEHHFSARPVSLEKPVALGDTNRLRVELKGGAPGSTLTVAIRAEVDEAACGMQLRIATPAADAAVLDPLLVVTGTVTGSHDMGVSVNGNPAALDLAHAGTAADPYIWVAEVPAEAGPLLVTAVARNAAGRSASATRTVTFAPDDQHLQLIAVPSFAMTDDEVSFELRNVPSGVAMVEADLDGDGFFEVRQSGTAITPARYDTPGTRSIAVRTTSSGGSTMTATAWLTIGDIAIVDPLLRQRWDDFRAALARQDVDAAVALMASTGAQDKYGRALGLFGPHLPDVAAHMAAIVPVDVRADFARYLLTRSDGARERSFYVYFVRNADGLWRIAQF